MTVTSSDAVIFQDGAARAPLRHAGSDWRLVGCHPAPVGVAACPRNHRRRCARLRAGRLRHRGLVGAAGGVGARLDHPRGPSRVSRPRRHAPRLARGRRAEAGRCRARGGRPRRGPQGQRPAGAGVPTHPALDEEAAAQMGLGGCPQGRAPVSAALRRAAWSPPRTGRGLWGGGYSSAAFLCGGSSGAAARDAAPATVRAVAQASVRDYARSAASAAPAERATMWTLMGEAATGLRRRALRRAWRLRRPDRWPMGEAATGPLRRVLRRAWRHWRRGHRLLAVTATWPR